MKQYLFNTTRLGMRNYVTADIIYLSEMNQNPAVMKHFPALQDMDRTRNFVSRMSKSIRAERLGMYAVDELSTGKFIGFIGLSEVLFDADFSPCVEIGWRLSPEFWHKGYATEGAKACLEFAQKRLKLKEIFAFATLENEASVAVMKRIGMEYKGEFLHPLIPEESQMKRCVLYNIKL